MHPGDAFVLNAPYAGGTHLPDVTVVMPVFLESGATPEFYVAARGHHADIGGITPGSMPSDSKVIDEEGVLLDNVQLVESRRVSRACGALAADVRRLAGAQCGRRISPICAPRSRPVRKASRSWKP